MLQAIAKALKELVETGSRVSDDTWGWINRVLTDNVDEAQEIAVQAARHVEESLTIRFEELEKRLSALETKSTKSGGKTS